MQSRIREAASPVGTPLRQFGDSGPPATALARRSGGARSAGPARGDLRLALSRGAPADRRARGRSRPGTGLQRRDGRPPDRAGLPPGRPGRGLPLLGPHGPARSARRHRPAVAAPRAVSRDDAAGHAPADAYRARSRSAGQPRHRHRDLAVSDVPVARPGPLRRRHPVPAAARARARLLLRRRAGAVVAADPARADAPPPDRHAAAGLHRVGQGLARGAGPLPRLVHERVLPLLRDHAADLGTQPRGGSERGRGDHDGRAVDDARAGDGRALRQDAHPLRGGGAQARAAGGRRGGAAQPSSSAPSST